MSAAPLACGVWPGRKGLVAVLVDNYDDGFAHPPMLVSTRCRESRWALLEHIDNTEGLDWQLVIPDWLARVDTMAELAVARGIVVWLVPPPVTDALRLLGRMSTLPAHRCAAALARLLAVPQRGSGAQRARPDPTRAGRATCPYCSFQPRRPDGLRTGVPGNPGQGEATLEAPVLTQAW